MARAVRRRTRAAIRVRGEPTVVDIHANPALRPQFPVNMQAALNSLPAKVKKSPTRATRSIKQYLVQEALGTAAIGWANQIRVTLRRFVNKEFMWDVVGRVDNPDHPGQNLRLDFVAESENNPLIGNIIEDANKLPVARAGIRMMFFRANDADGIRYVFEELQGLFEKHQASVPGDVYLLTGLNTSNLRFAVRKLTIRAPGANTDPWESY